MNSSVEGQAVNPLTCSPFEKGIEQARYTVFDWSNIPHNRQYSCMPCCCCSEHVCDGHAENEEATERAKVKHSLRLTSIH